VNPFRFMLQSVHDVRLFSELLGTSNFSCSVYSPDRTEGNVGLELSASVSSLHLEEAPPSATPSNFLATWATLRKASTPFFAGGTASVNVDFTYLIGKSADK